MNPLNITQAFFEALTLQKSPQDIAQLRGKKIMDVEMTYYGFTKDRV